jgi:hypothetical protein
MRGVAKVPLLRSSAPKSTASRTTTVHHKSAKHAYACTAEMRCIQISSNDTNRDDVGQGPEGIDLHCSMLPTFYHMIFPATILLERCVLERKTFHRHFSLLRSIEPWFPPHLPELEHVHLNLRLDRAYHPRRRADYSYLGGRPRHRLGIPSPSTRISRPQVDFCAGARNMLRQCRSQNL